VNFRRVSALLGFALASTIALGAARANGRFPRAQQLLERNGNPQQLVLSATYGILLTDDGGGEWRHLCELGFAFAVAEIDPLAGVFADGSMIVRGTRSLNRAEPPFCDFAPVLGGMGTETAVDFSLDRTAPNRTLALFMERGDAGGVVNRMLESTDAGQSFRDFGVPLPESEVVFGITLDIAPSDPDRIYVTAAGRDGTALFVSSADGAASFRTSVLELATDEYPYIAALDAANEDRVFVRTDSWMPNDEGTYEANDGLLLTDDGGVSFRELFRAKAKLLGFALSPDGGEVLLGYGDPVDAARSVDESVLGIYRASTTDFAFTKIYEGSVTCLAWTQTGLYACTSQDEKGFSLGFRADADFDLDVSEPFEPLLDLREVRGPLECPACTSGAACLDSWSSTCELFGSCDASVPAQTGGTACGGSAGATSAGGAGNFAGGSGGASSVGGTSNGPSPEAKDGSCGCTSPGRRTGFSSMGLLGFVAFAVLLRILRQRNRKHEPISLRPGSETTIGARTLEPIFQDREADET
jgi:hypothetical protein